MIEGTNPTQTVRVSRRLVSELEQKIPYGETARVLGPVLEPWVAGLFAQVPAHMSRLLAVGEVPEPPAPRPTPADATIRLPWWQVRRVRIYAEVVDKSVRELVEARLWDWLAGKPVIPAEPNTADGSYCGSGRELRHGEAAAARI